MDEESPSPMAQQVQELLNECAHEQIALDYPGIVYEAQRRYLAYLVAQGIIDQEAAMEQILEEQATLIRDAMEHAPRQSKPKLAVLRNRKW